MDSLETGTQPEESNLQLDDIPIEPQCRILGMGITFVLTYFLMVLFWIIYNEHGSFWTDNLPAMLGYSLIPAFVLSFVGGALGSAVSNYRDVKYAALVGSVYYSAAFFLLTLLLFGKYASSFYQILEIILAFGAMGAIVGGIVSIFRRNRIKSPRKLKWFNFYLIELLAGVFLMAVFIGCWSTFIRQLH